jgi:hypothetical protein
VRPAQFPLLLTSYKSVPLLRVTSAGRNTLAWLIWHVI